MLGIFLEEIYSKRCKGLKKTDLGINQSENNLNNIWAMTNVWLPDTTILINPLGRKIRNVLCIEDLSTLPLQMGPIRYQIDMKHFNHTPKQTNFYSFI